MLKRWCKGTGRSRCVWSGLIHLERTLIYSYTFQSLMKSTPTLPWVPSWLGPSLPPPTYPAKPEQHLSWPRYIPFLLFAGGFHLPLKREWSTYMLPCLGFLISRQPVDRGLHLCTAAPLLGVDRLFCAKGSPFLGSTSNIPVPIARRRTYIDVALD